MRRGGWVLLLLVAPGAPGCVSKDVRESARDVLTLRSGTVSELRDRRGRGPFRRYELPPAEMLEVLGAAARKARDLAGRPVSAVTVSARYGEVVAKERGPDDPAEGSYQEDWRTAVVATVHAVPGEPGASRVEIHAMRRSPLLDAAVEWEARLPGWIDEVLRERAATSPASR